MRIAIITALACACAYGQAKMPAIQFHSTADRDATRTNLGVVSGVTGSNGVDCATVGGAVTCDADFTVLPGLVENNSWTGHQYYPASSTQTLNAAGNTITCNRRTVAVDPQSNLTLTSAATIADGTNGQVCSVVNISSTYTLTLQDQDTLASSNLQLNSTSVTIPPKGQLTLQFNSTVGDWLQDGVSTGGSSPSATDTYWSTFSGAYTYTSSDSVTASLSNDQIRTVLVPARQTQALGRATLYVGTAAASSTCHVGVWGQDKTLIAQTGAIDTSTTGAKSAVFTTTPTITAGQAYYIGWACTASAVKFAGYSSGTSNRFADILNANSGTFIGSSANALAGGTLPNLGTITPVSQMDFPLILVWNN